MDFKLAGLRSKVLVLREDLAGGDKNTQQGHKGQ